MPKPFFEDGDLALFEGVFLLDPLRPVSIDHRDPPPSSLGKVTGTSGRTMFRVRLAKDIQKNIQENPYYIHKMSVPDGTF